MRISDYAAATVQTDIKKKGDRRPRFYGLGLLGEIGSLLAAIKKLQRHPDKGTAFADATIEEIGDVLWYFFRFTEEARLTLYEHPDDPDTFADLAGTICEIPHSEFDSILISLMGDAVTLIQSYDQEADGSQLVRTSRNFLSQLAAAAGSVNLDLGLAAERNLEKARSRWEKSGSLGDLYDEGLHPTEQLPRTMTVRFLEREFKDTAFCYQIYNGLTLGDRLTDNSRDEDGYRFHDCFHLAYAAILGWSPVLRSLLKAKRKSIPEVDDHEDGARAQISEEGVANWLFGEAKKRNFFEDTKNIETEMLMTVEQMVSEFEVSNRPYWVWEQAILKGFEIFRALKENGGGTVTIDLNKRSIEYAPPRSS